jgi:hypothetical protein
VDCASPCEAGQSASDTNRGDRQKREENIANKYIPRPRSKLIYMSAVLFLFPALFFLAEQCAVEGVVS